MNILIAIKDDSFNQVFRAQKKIHGEILGWVKHEPWKDIFTKFCWLPVT